ncbi:hypothetical protein [Candidatus Kuenenia sp.]|uniref:hypothetical protein n=1 Tax=Candidatus Kuenenia sp. TaxID=2499824 RepID=UPI00321FA5F6
MPILHNNNHSFASLLKQSTVSDVEGAFPKTILHFLNNNSFLFPASKTTEIFPAFNESLWISPQTVLKMDAETGVFGKRIRNRNSRTELLLASFKNIIAQFIISPFFPESIKGDFQLIPLKCPHTKNDVTYGISDSFSLNVTGNNPVTFSVYLGDGRSLRDMQRMIEDNADIRALKDIFGYLEDDSYGLFPIIPTYKIERHKDNISLSLSKNLLGERYRLKMIVEGIQDSSTKEIIIQEAEQPLVLSYFVIEEVKNNISRGEKGWELLNDILKKSPEWFKEKHLRLLRFSGADDNAESGVLPHQYKRYLNASKKDLYIIEILCPVFEIIPSKSNSSLKIDIKLTVNTTLQHYRPKPFPLRSIFKNDSMEGIHHLQNAKTMAGLIDEKIMSLLNMLEISYRSISFLIMNNMVLAGAFTYLTYFGRDTVFTHLLLKPFLTIFVQQKIVQQLLNRSNQSGEGAHETDSRILKENEAHYDYRMADTDFLIAISTFELLNEMSCKDIEDFLNHKDSKNRYNCTEPGETFFINNATVIIRNLNRALTLIENNDLVPLKRINDPSSANWRDAVNSFSRGTYSYDVNAVWVPHLLRLLESFTANKEKKGIFLTFLNKIQNLYPNHCFKPTETFLHTTTGTPGNTITTLIERNKKKFEISYSLEEWRTRLKSFYNDPQNHEKSIQDLKKMKIGYYLREHGQGRVWFTAEDFLDDRKWENSMKYQFEHLPDKFFLPDGNPFPNGIHTYTMALDKAKNPIPIMHSDLGFETFTKSMRKEHIEKELILPVELPLSLGGLAIIDRNGESLGFTVANPMLANKNGYKLLLTPAEKNRGIDPKTLSPWNLIGKNEYHGWGAIWEVMIDFMVAALQDADIQNHTYLKNYYWWVLENYTQYPRVRNKEVLGFKYNDNYKDWLLTESTVEKFEINDLQAFNAAGRLRVLLKALIPGITNFWLFKREEGDT